MALLQHMFASCATKAFSTNSAVHTQTCGKAATPYMPTKASLRDIAFFAAKGAKRRYDPLKKQAVLDSKLRACMFVCT